jgi:hypothetical protein
MSDIKNVLPKFEGKPESDFQLWKCRLEVFFLQGHSYPPTPPTVVHPDDAAPDVHTVPAQSVTFDDSVMPGGDESVAILPADMSNGNRDSGHDQEGEAAEGKKQQKVKTRKPINRKHRIRYIRRRG